MVRWQFGAQYRGIGMNGQLSAACIQSGAQNLLWVEYKIWPVEAGLDGDFPKAGRAEHHLAVLAG